MDGQPGGPIRGSSFLSGGRGSRLDGQNTIRTWDQYIPTYVCMHMCRHTHTLIETCKIMYRDDVRKIHAQHVEAYMRMSLSLNFPWKLNNLVPSILNYYIFIGYLKMGGMEEVRANTLNPNWIRHCLYRHPCTCMLMHRHSGYIIHEHATCMYFKKHMGWVILWTWAELAWAKFYVGRVVRNSTNWAIKAVMC